RATGAAVHAQWVPDCTHHPGQRVAARRYGGVGQAEDASCGWQHIKQERPIFYMMRTVYVTLGRRHKSPPRCSMPTTGARRDEFSVKLPAAAAACFSTPDTNSGCCAPIVAVD